jgi:hypothetical protein
MRQNCLSRLTKISTRLHPLLYFTVGIFARLRQFQFGAKEQFAAPSTKRLAMGRRGQRSE